MDREEDASSVQFTRNTGYCVKFGNELVIFHGDPDSDEDMYSVHNGQVYRLTIKPKERKVDE